MKFQNDGTSGQRRKTRRAGTLWALTALLLLWTGAPQAAEPPHDPRRTPTVEAVAKALPSVVNISTETVVQSQDPLDQLFGEFFGWSRRRSNSLKSLGSGVIIDEEGYILTNYHVIRHATRITVTLSDGREFEADPVIATTSSDVALLKIESEEPLKVRAIEFAADDDLILGETVLALGNPFGLGESVSRGILSSKARRPPVEDEPLQIQDWLQTDAAINPGNSGGPLINLNGKLAGLNVAVFRGGQGIGFAIPVKRISETLSKIFTPEGVRSLWFGAIVQSTGQGLVVRSVEPESPAELSGLQEGDIIASIDDVEPARPLDFNRKLIAAGAGKETPLQVRRDNQDMRLLVRLIPEKNFFNARLVKKRLGIVVEELEGASGRGTAIEGFLISEVEENGPAAKAGLQPGHIIQSVDNAPVRNLVEFARSLHRTKAGEETRLGIISRERYRGRLTRFYSGTAMVTLR